MEQPKRRRDNKNESIYTERSGKPEDEHQNIGIASINKKPEVVECRSGTKGQSTRQKQQERPSGEANRKASQQASTLEIIKSLAELLQTKGNNNEITINALKGHGQDVESWFRDYNRLTEAKDWSYERKSKRLTNCLRDRAIRYWELIPSHKKYEYETVRKYLIKKLQPKTDYIKELCSLNQGPGQPVEEYAAKIRRLARKKDIFSEQEITERFIKGLRPKISRAVVAVKHTKLSRKQKAAEEIEEVLEEAQRTIEINSVSSGALCYGFKQPGHLIRECPSKTNEQ